VVEHHVDEARRGDEHPAPVGQECVPIVRQPGQLWIDGRHDEADVVITLRNYFKQKAPALREAEERGLPIFVLKSNTLIQLESALTSIFALEVDPRDAALREVAEAIGLVHEQAKPVELSPQNAYVRRLQHQMAERNNLMSRSRGSEPNRRVEIVPDDGRAWTERRQPRSSTGTRRHRTPAATPSTVPTASTPRRGPLNTGSSCIQKMMTSEASTGPAPATIAPS
jgi:hypothetical protein